MAILTSKVGNNSLAFIQTKTKINRTLSRNKRLLNVKHSDVIEVGNYKFPISMIEIDNQQLTYAFEGIARGLYFYENNQIYRGKIKVISEIFNNEDYQVAMSFNNKWINIIENEAVNWGTKVLGENTKVFTNQFSPIDGFIVKHSHYAFLKELKFM